MINLTQDILRSTMWVIDANKNDSWFAYFDWLTQYQLTKNKLADCPSGYALYVDKKHLQTEHLLIVDFEKIDAQRFLEIWKSLGKKSAAIFNSQRDLTSYQLEAHPLFFVREEPESESAT
jgi:hypothetical protein